MLYFVSTPIGNLGDLTYRAVEVLRQVDTIACEDRQKSLRLLNHFDIHKPLLSFHAHNETQAVRQIIGLLSQGKQVAVISEAGTPGISDPAYSLVQALVQAALPFTLIPGASALVNALVPEARAATREISSALDSGKHTTTHATLYHLDTDSQLIDSPGLQEFGLGHLDRQEIELAFREFRPYLGQCRFRDCHHNREPDCALQAAVAAGEIDSRRFTIYHRIMGTQRAG